MITRRTLCCCQTCGESLFQWFLPVVGNLPKMFKWLDKMLVWLGIFRLFCAIKSSEKKPLGKISEKKQCFRQICRKLWEVTRLCNSARGIHTLMWLLVLFLYWYHLTTEDKFGNPSLIPEGCESKLPLLAENGEILEIECSFLHIGCLIESWMLTLAGKPSVTMAYCN